jgi:hypothetical protein
MLMGKMMHSVTCRHSVGEASLILAVSSRLSLPEANLKVP